MTSDKDYVITLDNNKKYALVNTLTLDGKKYVYLANLDNFSDYIIGEVVNDEVIHIENQELLGKLILEFSKLNS